MSSAAIPAQPEKILRALSQVWTSLGEEERQQGKPTVLRACAMTLIVITDADDQEQTLATQVLTELMHEHPSRAIVLRIDKNAENGLSARVFAQCWKPFGKAQQICCEQIEVSVAPERWPDVALTLLGIIVPDLPVVVWSRGHSVLHLSESPANRSGLASVLSLATKVVVDTSDTNLKTSLSALKDWKQQGQLIGDLEWTRLTAWRETLATVFDERPYLLKSGTFNSLELVYAGERQPTSAYYLAAWLEQGLGLSATYQSEPEEPGVGAGLTRMTLKSGDLIIDLAKTSPACLQLRVGDQEQKISLPPSSFYNLMHEELTILGSDPAFESAFDRTVELIQ